MNLVTHLSRNRVLLSILLPVLGAGLALSIWCLSFLAPPLIDHLRDSNDGHLRFASQTALNVCQDRLNFLKAFDSEKDAVVVSALKRQIVEELAALGQQLHDVHLAVLDEHGVVLGSSAPRGVRPTSLPVNSAISVQRWGNENVRVHTRYFAPWGWTLAAFISEKDFLEPIQAAQRVVYVGTFGVLAVVVLTLFAAFYTMVKLPLTQVVRATQHVAEGRLQRLNPARRDEIGHLALAFDSMVDSLEQNRERIEAILSQLRESEQQYRLVTEHSLANIVMIQGNRFIFANTRSVETAGLRREEFMGLDIARVIYPEDRERVLKKIADLENREVEREHFEFRCITQHNDVIWQEMLAVPISYKGRSAVLGHSIDITARKLSEKDKEKLEAALHEAKKMEAVGTLAGGIAHDFNNLLQAIHGYAEVLLLQNRNHPESRKDLENILGAARRGRELIRQLLTFGRKVETQVQPVDLNAQIAEVRELLDHTIPKSIKIETDLTEGLSMVKADPVQVQRVLLNLVFNAKDAMPAGGTLRLGTKGVVFDHQHELAHPDMIPGRYVLLTVADTGCGMAQDVKEHIFEPFYTTKAPGHGTGLGLAMVYGSIRHWGGAISCESEVGKGASFEILFPALDEPDVSENSEDDEGLIGGNETILLVDDEPLIRDLGETMLSMVGYTVLTASDGKSAIEVYSRRKSEIALVILDVVMPEMGGSQCLKALLDIEPRVKVLLASGYHYDGDEFAEAISLARGFITKPYDMQRILEVVRETIDSD